MTKQWILNGTEFAIGNVVRVMRQVQQDDPNGMGDGVAWNNNWVGIDDDNSCGPVGMNKHLGGTFVIADICDEGVEFEGADEVSFLFPLASLDKIANAMIERKAA
jgi:hypothetical protein